MNLIPSIRGPVNLLPANPANPPATLPPNQKEKVNSGASPAFRRGHRTVSPLSTLHPPLPPNMPEPQFQNPELRLRWLPGRYAVVRLSPNARPPEWSETSSPTFLSVTRTNDELSIVADASAVPADVRAERGWSLLRVEGTLDFALLGILSRLTGALTRAEISVFAISTFDTDYLLVREPDRARAENALRAVATFIAD